MGQTLNRLANRPADNRRSQPQEITTRRAHFRGALLGLAIAPTAVPLAIKGDGPSATVESLTHVSATHVSATVETSLQRRVEHCLGQVRHFLSSPLVPAESVSLGAVPLRGAVPLDSTSTQASQNKTWLDAVPILLRYCDHPASHSLWKADAVTTAQYWILSDILAQAMSRQPLNKNWLKQQAQQATQTKDTSLAACHYRWLWDALINTLLIKTPFTQTREKRPSPSRTPQEARYQADTPAMVSNPMKGNPKGRNRTSQELPTPHEAACHRTVVTGIACALAFTTGKSAAVSANYSLSVAMAAQSISADTDWEALLIAGLVSGAIVGYSDLPVLWQQTADADTTSLADALFYEWAGTMVEH